MPNPPPKREAGQVSASMLYRLEEARKLAIERRRVERALKQQALWLLEQPGVTKTVLARALGVSRQTVYNWIREAENGR